MLTYLNVVLAHSEQWLGIKATPAGILYFHVHNPMISTNEQMQAEDISDEILKKYKMQGLVLSNEEVVNMMDTSLEVGSSPIIPVGDRKSTRLNSSHVATSYAAFCLKKKDSR